MLFKINRKLIEFSFVFSDLDMTFFLYGEGGWAKNSKSIYVSDIYILGILFLFIIKTFTIILINKIKQKFFNSQLTRSVKPQFHLSSNKQKLWF